jgi:hypothetical protein
MILVGVHYCNRELRDGEKLQSVAEDTPSVDRVFLQKWTSRQTD